LKESASRFTQALILFLTLTVIARGLISKIYLKCR
jgi:hypothetical protein